jgi:ubiquitin-protein ligase
MSAPFLDDYKGTETHGGYNVRIKDRLKHEIRLLQTHIHIRQISRDAAGIFTVSFYSGYEYTVQLENGYPFTPPIIKCITTQKPIRINEKDYSPAQGINVIVSVEMENLGEKSLFLNDADIVETKTNEVEEEEKEEKYEIITQHKVGTHYTGLE